MNSEGGFLFIGVNNQKQVIGLECDLAQVKESLDEYEMTFTNAINTYIGKINRLLVSFTFERNGNKIFAVADVKPSPHQVYLKVEGKDPEFYIRAGNTSQRLNISEASQYIKEHWLTL